MIGHASATLTEFGVFFVERPKYEGLGYIGKDMLLKLMVERVRDAFTNKIRGINCKIPRADNGEPLAFLNREFMSRFTLLDLELQKDFLSFVASVMEKKNVSIVRFPNIQWGLMTRRTLKITEGSTFGTKEKFWLMELE